MVYYLDQEKKVVYRSNLETHNFEDIAILPDKFTQINGWEVSGDKNKLFIFNRHQISVIFFDTQKDYEYAASEVFLDYPQEEIMDVFWHSDSYHLVVLTNKHIQVVESCLGAIPISLIELNKAGSAAFYDAQEDMLYFSDSQRSPEGSFYNNLYKLELSPNLYLADRLSVLPLGKAMSAVKGKSGE